MKTYEITHNYDEVIRVTVGSDVRARVRGSYESRPYVYFEREVERYDSEIVYSITNVTSLVLLDDTVDIKRLDVSYENKQAEEQFERTEEWVDATPKK